MEDWKYKLYTDLVVKDPDTWTTASAASGRNFSKNQKKTFRREARDNYNVKEGILYYKKKVKQLITINLRPIEEMNDNPVEGIDFKTDKVETHVWKRVLKHSDFKKQMEEIHDNNAHRGRDACHEIMKQQYYFHGLWTAVSTYIQQCDICQRTRTDGEVAPLEHIIPEAPYCHLQIDFTTIQGLSGYLLVVIDCFSKHVWLKYLPTKESAGVAAFLVKIIQQEGRPPKRWHTDNGGEFVSDIIDTIAEQYGIEVVHGRPYHPEAQGHVERANGTIKKLVRKMLKAADVHQKRYDLVELIERSVYIYNNTPHSSTKFSPIEVLRPVLQTPEKLTRTVDVIKYQNLQRNSINSQVRSNLEAAAKKNDKQRNRGGKLRVFEIGQKVLYRIPERYRAKNTLAYDALGIIREVLRNNRYVVEFSDAIHSNLPKNFAASTLRRYNEPSVGAAITDQIPSNATEVSNTSNEQIGTDLALQHTDEPNELNENEFNEELFSFNDDDDNEEDDIELDENIIHEAQLYIADLPNIEEDIVNFEIYDTHTDEVVTQINTEEPDYELTRPRKRRKLALPPGLTESRQFKILTSNNKN